ncbi:DUF3570 domain-containing protein [Polyangium mundeleinium]|uniref:DUF3570 domain-containing protein n=1 Tax=Polyangium mundeleinium TaxID=2995306 RepID=A0ABT5F1T9_9BACT|nr:DUF3570 domain-containing protein [Polyangium mundeleinium]MDC0747961.1 DUF3570 domain-containing protein [Polyangium mundeleinium]
MSFLHREIALLCALLSSVLSLPLSFASDPKAATPVKRQATSGLDASASAETSFYLDDTHVGVVTPTIAGTISSPTAGWSLSGRYLVDVVTAASPDIVATASPPWTEVRHAGNLEGGYEKGDVGVGAHASLSREPDYLSISAGLRGTLELDEKNYGVLLGYAYRHDTAGRAGTPFDVFGWTLERHDLNAGLTIVVNPSTIAAIQLDAMFERGNQAKPYRYVPLFEAGAAEEVPVGASVELVSALRLHARPLEALPFTRDRFALTGRLAHRRSGGTLRVEERLYTDSWGMAASTTDARYSIDIGRYVTIWPRLRFHAQTGTVFWQRATEVAVAADGSITIPEIRTGDRELGPLWTLTGGGGVSVKLGARFTASLQVDGVFTHYLDALYLTRRNALFSALALQATFD